MIGQYYDEERQELLMMEKLPMARAFLKKFDALNSLFSSFAGYENKKYNQAGNIVFRMCLPFMGEPNTRFEEELRELDDALKMFNVLDLQDEKMNDLKSRLRDDDFYQSLTAYTELIIAKRLVGRLGKDNVKIYPELSVGGFSDILVKLGSKSIYIEVGNLAKSEPERKIERILNEGAKYLASKLPVSNYFLELDVDTAEFVVDQDGHIDEMASVKKLTSEIDRLCIDKLAGFEGRISMNDIANTIRYKESMEKHYKFLPEHEKKNLELIKNPSIEKWVNSCEDQILQGSGIIRSILGWSAKSRLIEIHPKMIYPSVAALKERDSFINHIIRHIKAQLEDHQLQPDSPNIIMVQGSNWTIFGLGRDLLDIGPLHRKIMEFLGERKEKYLSGIALFDTDFSHSVFITNEYASTMSRLSKNEVEMLGMHYFDAASHILP